MNTLTFNELPSAVSQLVQKLDNLERLILQHIGEEPQEQSEQLLTVEEAAKFLSLAIPTIYSKVSRKELPFMKRAKRLYFSRTELLDYLKEGRNQTGAEIKKEAHTYIKKA